MPKQLVYDRRFKAMKVFVRTRDVYCLLDSVDMLKVQADSWRALVPAGSGASQTPGTDVKKQWQAVKRMARNDEPLSRILLHPFFTALHALPTYNAEGIGRTGGPLAPIVSRKRTVDEIAAKVPKKQGLKRRRLEIREDEDA